MSSGVALQKQIASIMDELAKAAVAEISKVVDDGVVMLRLEICEREHEIDSLKRNLQMVSEELRETRRALVRQCVSGARPRQPLKGDGSSWSLSHDGHDAALLSLLVLMGQANHPEDGVLPV